MAFADYRLCDKCGAKTFYDATLDYEGELLRGVGSWAVICKDCATEHECLFTPIGLLAAVRPLLDAADAVVAINGTRFAYMVQLEAAAAKVRALLGEE